MHRDTVRALDAGAKRLCLEATPELRVSSYCRAAAAYLECAKKQADADGRPASETREGRDHLARAARANMGAFSPQDLDNLVSLERSTARWTRSVFSGRRLL